MIVWVASAYGAEPYAEIDAALASRDFATAADQALAILDDPSKAALAGGAYARLGDAFDGDKKPYAAVLAWSRAIAADPIQADRVGGLALLRAQSLGDDGAVATALVGVDLSAVEPGVRSRLALACAKERARNGEWGAALERVEQIDKKSAQFPSGQLIKGVVLANQGRPGDALAPLLTAEALVKADVNDDAARLQDLVELNLARAYFAVGNDAKAIYYDAKVERMAPEWPEVQLERAWAHFRIDDPAGSLAALQNHDTAFLADGWWPEADLLRIYDLFVMCKFTTADVRLEAFKSDWTTPSQELTAAVSGSTAATAWTDLAKRGGGTLPDRLLGRFWGTEGSEDALRAVTKADAEIAALGANPSSRRASDWIEARRDAIQAAEGARVLAYAQSQERFVRDALVNADITKLDILQFQTRLLERAAATGQAPTLGDGVGDLRKEREKRGFRTWAYEGESWADELGYYAYDVRPDCPEGLRVR